jgi:hypothetical protein
MPRKSKTSKAEAAIAAQTPIEDQSAKGFLIAQWGANSETGQPCTQYSYGNGAQEADVIILAQFFEQIPCWSGKTLMKELQDRGFDPKTMQFTISRQSDDATA